MTYDLAGDARGQVDPTLVLSLQRLLALAVELESGGADAIARSFPADRLPARLRRDRGVDHIAMRGVLTGLAGATLFSAAVGVAGFATMQLLPAAPRPSLVASVEVGAGIHEGAEPGQ